MPRALALSAEEKAQVDQGLCACGCGETPEPSEDDWGRETAPMWFSPACKMRAHRKRKKEGRTIDNETRRRMAYQEEATEKRAAAAEIARRIRAYQNDHALLIAAAERLEALASGQLELPGLSGRSDSR